MRKLNPLRSWNVIIIVIASFFPVNSFGQYPPDSIKHWVTVLSANDNSGNPLVEYLTRKLLNPIDTCSPADRQSLREALDEKRDDSNPYFTVRRCLLDFYLPTNVSNNLSFEQALNIAYELGDEELIAFASWQYGSLMTMYRTPGLAVMYSLNAAEIYEKIGKPLSGKQYLDLGEALYSIREYEKSLYYTKQAALQLRSDFYMTTCVNTIGLNYQKLGRYDSALLYYDSAFLFTRNFGKDEKFTAIWKGILSGNKGQVYFLQGQYQRALPLFEFDFQQSSINGEYDNAANSLQWAAKTNLALGNTSKALLQIREAFQWLAKRDVKNYRQNLLRTAEEIYQEAGMKDSALYFGSQYMSLHDSIEAEVANARLEISQMKLENERNYYNIKSFKQQREREILARNMIIAGVLFLAIIALLFMNAQRVKTLHRQQMLAAQNRSAEIEIANAKKELETFRQTLIEKTTLISQLQDQVDNTALSNEQQLAMSNLLQSSILTDDQWMNFKGLLEKIYPGFFHRLKESYPDITMAEQRMAALSKLKLSARETAAMLGISVDSVHKTRQRLKQRLNLSAEENLEEYVAAL